MDISIKASILKEPNPLNNNHTKMDVKFRVNEIRGMMKSDGREMEALTFEVDAAASEIPVLKGMEISRASWEVMKGKL